LGKTEQTKHVLKLRKNVGKFYICRNVASTALIKKSIRQCLQCLASVSLSDTV